MAGGKMESIGGTASTCAIQRISFVVTTTNTASLNTFSVETEGKYDICLCFADPEPRADVLCHMADPAIGELSKIIRRHAIRSSYVLLFKLMFGWLLGCLTTTTVFAESSFMVIFE
jgi:hypothetical protein